MAADRVYAGRRVTTTTMAKGSPVTKRQALSRARRATENADDSLLKRDAAIRDAAEFASLREIAEAVGLSKPRIHQIVGTRGKP